MVRLRAGPRRLNAQARRLRARPRRLTVQACRPSAKTQQNTGEKLWLNATFTQKARTARVQWHKVFSEQLPGFATKYGISLPDVAQAAADYLWIEWIVGVRNALNNYSQQVTRALNDVAGNDPEKDPPAVLVDFDIGTRPTQPPPGIEFRAREWAGHIKGHSDYAEADGEAMGIEGAEAEPTDPGSFTPDYTVKTLANFELEVGFRKLGMDAVKFQFRYKGGDWLSAGFLVTASGVLSISRHNARPTRGRRLSHQVKERQRRLRQPLPNRHRDGEPVTDRRRQTGLHRTVIA